MNTLLKYTSAKKSNNTTIGQERQRKQHENKFTLTDCPLRNASIQKLQD